MALINVSLPSDGTTADVSDYNTPVNTIVNEFNGSIDNANIKTGAAIATSKLASDEGIVNGMVADSAITPEKLLASTGTSWAWQDWTPSYSSVTVGNGTVVAKYCQIGKTIHFVWTLDIGSTTVIGNNITISAPVTASAYFNNGFVPIGNASAEDSGTSHSFGFVYFDESATNMLCRWNDGTGNSTSVFPITEAAGDHFAISGAYEAA
jgi:hypothetical protein